MPGPAAAACSCPRVRMAALMDTTINALSQRLTTEKSDELTLTMQFPSRWDPYFEPTMSVLDVYHYGTKHYNHHRDQLTYA